jgi:hypothetical protein
MNIFGTLWGTLAEFFGRLLGALLPAVGREIRKNRTVKRTGADNETLNTLDSDVWNTARSSRVQRHVQSKNRTTS